MAGKAQVTRANAKGSGRGRGRPRKHDPVPELYQEMLAEALPTQSSNAERPLKRRRAGVRAAIPATTSAQSIGRKANAEKEEEGGGEDEDEEDLQFEDVLGLPDQPSKAVQTVERNSDDSTDSEPNWDMNFEAETEKVEGNGDLELTLNPKPATPSRMTAERRRTISREERGLRLQIHKIHVLCLLSHLERRNRWCNDEKVQASLQPLLTKKMLTCLLPKSTLTQLGRTESLKSGLEQVSIMWRTKFKITARGMRRALWAEDENDLQNLKLSDDFDRTFEKSDFQAAAKSLKGSRDLGLQLFCALLRGAGLDVRLVCSIQALPFTPGGPTMFKGPVQTVPAESFKSSDEGESLGKGSPSVSTSFAKKPATSFTARGRLGHPNAADFQIPEMATPPRPVPKPKSKKIHESPYPVFWVEVLDEAHQKWLAVDPLVTYTVAKTRVFEPPASDRENSMSYVIAFEDEGTARDVTRRYAKAYNAKTRKRHVDSTDRGREWWRQAMKPYTRLWTNDIDQIEDTELATAEAREPMPKNVADFKDHPYYALERHMKRSEVLVSKHEVGKVAAGRDFSTPGRKKLESIYRRRDIKVAKSLDAWYRLGRDVKMGVQPVKTVPARRKPDEDMESTEDSADTNLYTEIQTELYIAPPVVNGRVPKNSFGNLDIYVPSMVPPGGIHIRDETASRAARLLSIDYADALTGFEFRGRCGTAILKGVVVAAEYREAMEAVIEGFQDQIAQAEEEMRTRVVLRMWKRLLVGLRIKERVDVYKEEGEEEELEEKSASEMLDEEDDEDEYVDEGGGGFFPE